MTYRSAGERLDESLRDLERRLALLESFVERQRELAGLEIKAAEASARAARYGAIVCRIQLKDELKKIKARKRASTRRPVKRKKR